MENLVLITRTLELLEDHLTENIKTEEIARRLYCSKSTLEKLFRFATNMSIRDYVIRRRMSRAARDLAADPEEAAILDVALKYGYNSHEAFTRAFKSVWNITPSEYRKNPVRYELFPAFRLEKELMEDERMKSKKKVDISKLYDDIRERQSCYFVAVDIKNLIPINEISRKAGDLAILTAMNRLETAAGEEDIVFRIGGDEFVALTNSKDKAYAEAMAAKILKQNGEPFSYEGREIPLNLHVTCYQLETANLKYAELLADLQNRLDQTKA